MWRSKSVRFFALASCSLLVSIFAGLNAQPVSKAKTKTDAPYLVVLSLDGFRWDYPDRYHTPTLDSIAAVGVKAQSLVPSFPSKTFPNHYTIATGLYPQDHGIVLNSFFDNEEGEYRLSNRAAVQNPNFYLGEPIWVTAEQQGLRSACYFWPGSEAPVMGTYPSTWKAYNGSVSYASRIDSIVAWLEKPAESRPHLIMWYLDEPDHTGHAKGPFAAETKAEVEQLDSLLGVFCRKLNGLALADSINLVFTSDHGMGEIRKDKSVAIDDYVKPAWVMNRQGNNPVYMLDAKPGFEAVVAHALSDMPHVKTYTRESMPADFHYSQSDRILDFVCVADSGWAVHWNEKQFTNGGTHGYDPKNTDMHAIFYAVGPAFKQGEVVERFSNVNLYALFAKILELNPAPTEGKPSVVESLLRKSY